MKIELIFRPISRAPLEVLEDLYWRTAHYGISVRAFTGKHQDYWENLPAALREVQHDQQKLAILIEELEAISGGAEERLQKRRAQIQGKWAEKEVVLNAQILSVLSAIPDQILAMTYKHITGDETTGANYQVVDLKITGDPGEDKNFVHPDLLLLGDNGHLIMIEVKTRGGAKSTRSYPANQLLNYMKLVVECKFSNDSGLPNRFSHLILVPTTDPKWLVDHENWIVQTCDPVSGRVCLDVEKCLRQGRKLPKRYEERIRQVLEETPIYYRSWHQLTKAFEAAIDQYDDGMNESHWKRIGKELADLADRASTYA